MLLDFFNVPQTTEGVYYFRAILLLINKIYIAAMYNLLRNKIMLL